MEANLLTSVLSVYGRYRFRKDIPSISSDGIPEGSYVSIGHSDLPSSGDVVYLASSSWKRLSGLFVQGAYESFPFASRPNTRNAIAAVNFDEKWTLYQPQQRGSVMLYDYNYPLGVLYRSFDRASKLPNIVPPVGSLILYDYDYPNLDNSAKEGDTAYFSGNSFVFIGGQWQNSSIVQPRALIAIDGVWTNVSPSLASVSMDSGVMTYSLPSDAKPTFSGVNNGDMAFHFDENARPTVEWSWTGSDWVRIPLVQYIDQLGARNANIDYAVIRKITTQQLDAGVIRSGDNVGPHSSGQGYILDKDGMVMYGADGTQTVGLDAETGLATFRNARIINGQVVVSGVNGTSLLDDEGFEYRDVSGNPLVLIGHGIPTGMGVRDPRSGQVVPLSSMVFGGFSMKLSSVVYTDNAVLSPNVGGWTKWFHTDSFAKSVSTPTGSLLLALFAMSNYNKDTSFIQARAVVTRNPVLQYSGDSFPDMVGYIDMQYSNPYMNGLSNGLSIFDTIDSLPKDSDLYVHLAFRSYAFNLNSSNISFVGNLDAATVWGIPS